MEVHVPLWQHTAGQNPPVRSEGSGIWGDLGGGVSAKAGGVAGTKLPLSPRRGRGCPFTNEQELPGPGGDPRPFPSAAGGRGEGQRAALEGTGPPRPMGARRGLPGAAGGGGCQHGVPHVPPVLLAGSAQGGGRGLRTLAGCFVGFLFFFLLFCPHPPPPLINHWVSFGLGGGEWGHSGPPPPLVLSGCFPHAVPQFPHPPSLVSRFIPDPA